MNEQDDAVRVLWAAVLVSNVCQVRVVTEKADTAAHVLSVDAWARRPRDSNFVILSLATSERPSQGCVGERTGKTRLG